MSRSANRAPRDQQCPPRRRRRPSRSIVLLLALLAATFVSVGSALADEEAAPPAPEPATVMPDDVVISDPEVQPVVEEAPEPAAPAVEAPAEPAVAPDVAPSDAAPAEAAPVEATPAVTAGAAVEAEAPIAAEAFAAEAAAPAAQPEPAARVATADAPAIQARVQVCPDPAWPGSYPSGGSCKINICHATGSETNPYVFISPNVNSLNGHFNANHQKGEDVIGVASAADCPGGGVEDPCGANPRPGAYVNENGQCVIDFCHATGNGSYTSHVGQPLSALNGHSGHANDIIPMPLGGCPTDTPDCEPPSFPHGGTCKVNICHATGSETNPYEFITVAAQGLEGHGDHPNDIIGVASEADCVNPNDCEPPAYEDTNGRCVIDICHAEGDPLDYTAMTILVSQMPTHQAHPNDVIPAPANGCPTDEADCEPPAYEDTNGRCVIDICEAEGSPVAGWTFMTILFSQLPAHAAHTSDIIPAPETGCPDDVDYCPGPLNPGTQPYGTTCIDDACPGALNPGNQPAGTVCIVDACPDDLNPGNQPFGTTCIADACPGLLNPGNQPAGTVCIVDACPDALNPGNQAPGTTCITDACPDQLNPGNQPAGTVCAVPTPAPVVPTPTPAAPTPVAPTPTEPTPTPAEPTAPEVVEVTPEPEAPTVVLGEEVEPTPVTAGAGTLPFTGARTFGLTLLGVIAFLAGAALVRRRPRRTS